MDSIKLIARNGEAVRTTHPVEQVKGGKAAVSDEDQYTIGQPTFDERDHLPGAFGQLLMLAFLLRLIAVAARVLPNRSKKEGHPPRQSSLPNLTTFAHRLSALADL